MCALFSSLSKFEDVCKHLQIVVFCCSFLQDRFVQLACDKYGSHVVDACWSILSLDFKCFVANELLAQEATLRSNFFGRHVLVNCNIDEFKHRRHQWNEQQKTSQKRKSTLSDFLKDISVDTVKAPRAKRKKL